ncbi:Com family DNA-binding transcriptional regulator [Neptunomonas antarctica]|uniref:Com family DNA-binding transcriptional regulator n=1 Tax=Neptunomonas antarctica TaxID=619304 RepID=UPI000970F337|nr:Com family DNA-binding transcriptional regulator [Neptunomonas antarctica]
MLNEIRCTKCSKLLAKAIFSEIEIKCPRCRHIQRAMSPITKDGVHHGKTSNSLDRRQAPPG